MSAEQVLSPPQAFGFGQTGRRRVDFTQELRKEPGACVRGDLPRVVPGVHLVGCDGCTQ
jgi:hypothetical protein